MYGQTDLENNRLNVSDKTVQVFKVLKCMEEALGS